MVVASKALASKALASKGGSLNGDRLSAGGLHFTFSGRYKFILEWLPRHLTGQVPY